MPLVWEPTFRAQTAGPVWISGCSSPTLCERARVAEWQTRWLQVPVSERAWGFKSPLAHHNVLSQDEGNPRTPRVRGFLRFQSSSGSARSVAGERDDVDHAYLRGLGPPATQQDAWRHRCYPRRALVSRGLWAMTAMVASCICNSGLARPAPLPPRRLRAASGSARAATRAAAPSARSAPGAQSGITSADQARAPPRRVAAFRARPGGPPHDRGRWLNAGPAVVRFGYGQTARRVPHRGRLSSPFECPAEGTRMGHPHDQPHGIWKSGLCPSPGSGTAEPSDAESGGQRGGREDPLSLIHISEPTRPY